ncbi:hypothetical protein NC797_08480 [Aquibacillus sp. 3ASR75-11]|uniref:Uncharacterized protein n=1 Tax=Terrihalobacillus insolitus TaxID=2950438 RepID=A0A9X3WSD3_9BACI|nr:hypothetical protein [Terrihalobacillus insolitus]MDC3413808.1 hypothetical protein [Terrihalobacillus insolitus]MDC3424545.1 hypothetical protein [Terrihalobacillus insolitus]
MKKKLTLSFFLSLLLLFLIPFTSFAAEKTTVPIEDLKPAVHLEKPTLQPTGGTLILSDSPETYKEDGAFYRDSVTGEFRIFWHHQNRSGETRTVAVAITNTSDQTVQLFDKGQGVTADYYPDVAGKQALVAFLENKSEKKYVTTLDPGESYFLETSAEDLYTVSGIAQFVVYNKHGNDKGTVTVTTLNYLNEKPENPLDVPVLPGDTHTRGTFPHFERTGTLNYDTELGNAYIRLSSAASGQWSDKLPGEYEAGVSAVDNNEPVINNGNYGVTYNLDIKIANSLSSPQLIDVYDNPSGGFGRYVMSWNGHVSTSGYLSYLNAWKFADLNVGANGNDYNFVTSLPGGASGPSVIYFVPSSN